MRKSSEKQFDYVNPRNREVQIEMEKVVTAHLAAIHALVDVNDYLKPEFDEQHFDQEASVIIPVFNREKTVADAVESALTQKAKFDFNVIDFFGKLHFLQPDHYIFQFKIIHQNLIRVIFRNICLC